MNRRTFIQSLLGLAAIPNVPSFEFTQNVTRIAFGSCANQNRSQKIWKSILNLKPDLFVFLGDNIYADTENMEIMSACYQKLANNPDFQNFRNQVPIIGTWDDHDYGKNDSGHEYLQKHESKKLFLQFFKEPPTSQRSKRPGVYTSYFVGNRPHQTQVILLDLRWFRSPLSKDSSGRYIPTLDSSATLLGEDQWQWLEAQLQKPAAYRLLGSSIQLVSAEHDWEKWANFPNEKMRFYQLLDQYNIQNLSILSGDMHFGELSKEITPGGIELYELTSSGLNLCESGKDIENSRRLHLFDENHNFGLVEINWRFRRPEVKLQIHTHNRLVFEQKINAP